jgi:hypothetical protein
MVDDHRDQEIEIRAITINADDAMIAVARRRVADGQFIIWRQRELIERLRLRGRSTRQAEETLRLFVKSQAALEQHLAALLRRRTPTRHYH